MIAGEFAVLEPYQKLAVMAVDRFVFTTIQNSEQNYLSLMNFQMDKLNWRYDSIRENVFIDTDDKRVDFVANAMSIALTYLKECGISPSNFSLTINSELDEAGVKYGLGSSAAVVTSAIAAILNKYMPENVSEELIFKLAAITHATTQGNGSGADVAASSYGGVLAYSSFQAEWLNREFRNRVSLKNLIGREWKYLSVQPLLIPEQVHICVGWTGKPASTKKLVNELLKLKVVNAIEYELFLKRSEEAVNLFLNGMKETDTSLIIEGIRRNRRALAKVGKEADVEIETPLLTKLCDIAEYYNGAGKPSGAGGGDCGIAIMPSEESADRVKKAWQKAGIKVLELNVPSKGAISI